MVKDMTLMEPFPPPLGRYDDKIGTYAENAEAIQRAHNVAMLGDAVWAHFSGGWLFYVGGFGFAALIVLSVLLDEGK